MPDAKTLKEGRRLSIRQRPLPISKAKQLLARAGYSIHGCKPADAVAAGRYPDEIYIINGYHCTLGRVRNLAREVLETPGFKPQIQLYAPNTTTAQDRMLADDWTTDNLPHLL